MIRITLAVVGALMALSFVEAGGFDNLKAKLRNKFEMGASGAYGVAAANNVGYGGYGGYGGGAAAATSAAAAGSRGGRYGGSNAAASASAGASGYENLGYGGYPAPAYGAEYDDTIYGGSNHYSAPPAVRSTPQRPRFRSYAPDYVGSGASAAAAAAASTSVGVAAPVPLRPAPPARPIVNTNAYRTNNVALNYVPPVANRFTARRPAVYGGGSASAAASALASNGAASSAASAAATAGGRVGSGVVGGAASQVLASSAGTYSNNDNGRESSSYKRSTENVQNHEDGHVDDNHYYNAQSYGKAEDEDMHEAFNKNDEDIEQTPTVYKSKKSGENYVMDFKKARRESGSGVLAKDKHSSAFNKNSKKFIENVDQAHSKSGDGFFEDENRVSTQNLDDEDEEIYDSDGFGQQPVHLPVRAAGGAAAASAASGSGAVSSSAAAAGAARGF